MKYLLLTLIILTLFGNVSGQKIEYSVSLNSGLFSFIGGGIGKTTVLEEGANSEWIKAKNSYGTINGLCHGISFTLKKINKANYFYGLDLGYEILRSKENIGFWARYNGTPSDIQSLISSDSATGKVFLNNSFINLNPFIGHRYKLKQVYLDLIVGVDLGLWVNASEEISATTYGGSKFSAYNSIAYNYTSRHIDVDIRPRFQLLMKYKKFGIYGGYSLGITNYYHNKSNNWNTILQTRFIRFGVTCYI